MQPTQPNAKGNAKRLTKKNGGYVRAFLCLHDDWLRNSYLPLERKDASKGEGVLLEALFGQLL